MAVDKKVVDDVAFLARLEFDANTKDEMVKDMNRMLTFVDKLNELNTDGIEPLVYMVDEVDVLREDVASNTVTQKEALKNAPQKDSDYFKVPKVVERK